MKHLLLSAALLLAACPVIAQKVVVGQESQTPFKSANTLIIHTSDSSSFALKKLAKALVIAGIEPDKLEPEIGYLTAKGQSSGSMNPAVFNYKIVASSEPGGTTLTISGTCTTRASFTHTIDVPMVWGATGNSKKCFALIEPVALSYASAKIGYLQKGENKAVLR
jgi:hypothetical protein